MVTSMVPSARPIFQFVRIINKVSPTINTNKNTFTNSFTTRDYFYFFIPSQVCVYFLFSLKPNKSNLNNKILLRNLLESFDLDLPDELKRLDNSSADPQKLS